MKFPWILAVILLLPAAAQPQTLGEVAAKEAAKRKEREAKAKEKSQVFTNDDLEHGQKKPKDASAATPAAVPEPLAGPHDAPSLIQKDQQIWKERADKVRSALKAALERKATLEAEAQEIFTRKLLSTDTNEILRLSAEQKEKQDEITTATEEIDTAKKAVEDFEESARAASIPAGWIEPQTP